jgi:F-type H+-transporting ATPase subunit a
VSTTLFHATATIEQPGTHTEGHFLGLTINTDTVLTTVIAAILVIGLGLIVRAKVSSGVPSGPQLFLETVFKWVQDQVEENIGLKVAPYVVPLAFTLFVFILICNWFSVLPVQFNGKDLAPPPTADVNLTYALTVLVIVWVHVAGFRANGFGGYLGHIAKGPGGAAFLAPINIIIEVIANPIALALRLFGNIFAGTIMVSVIGLLPSYILWAPNFGWKLFDLAIGLIQAFVFALLTILYFGQAARSAGEAGAH